MTMTRARAEEILDAYGADPARWPAAERDALRAMIAAEPALAAARDAARRLDAALGVLPPPPALALNPVAIAAAARRLRGGAAPARRLWARAAGLAAAALVGVWVGWSGIVNPPGDEREDALAFLAGVEGDVL
jgi:hypothetical protein